MSRMPLNGKKTNKIKQCARYGKREQLETSSRSFSSPFGFGNFLLDRVGAVGFLSTFFTHNARKPSIWFTVQFPN